MPEIDIGALRAAAEHLNPLGINYAFTGGSVINLLLDDPEECPARPTKDVDVIIELVTGERYSRIEERLREVGFQHDVSEEAPICRWRIGKLVVDIMPTDGSQLGLNTKWFSEALETATEIEYAHTKLRVVSPIALLATKYLTFTERGDGDYYASHDLEDFMTIVDGRQQIVEEIDATRADLREYLIGVFKALSEEVEFQDALPGYLRPDSASQARLPILRKRLQQVAALT